MEPPNDLNNNPHLRGDQERFLSGGVDTTLGKRKTPITEDENPKAMRLQTAATAHDVFRSWLELNALEVMRPPRVHGSNTYYSAQGRTHFGDLPTGRYELSRGPQRVTSNRYATSLDRPIPDYGAGDMSYRRTGPYQGRTYPENQNDDRCRTM